MGTYTGNSNNQTITFANSDTFTPRFLLIKNAVGTHSWVLLDIMRGFGAANGAASNAFLPDAVTAEGGQGGCTVGAGTFAWGSNLSGGTLSKVNESGQTYIYVAFA